MLKLTFLTSYLRAKWYSLFFKHMGDSVFIGKSFSCDHPQNVTLGHHIYINHHVHIDSNSVGIKIGNYVQIAPYVTILNAQHEYGRTDIPMFNQKGYKAKPVIIGDDVWIGLHATILPGVCVAKGSVIGAGAVVTKDVAPYTVVGGIPAKFIKSRLKSNKK